MRAKGRSVPQVFRSESRGQEMTSRAAYFQGQFSAQKKNNICILKCFELFLVRRQPGPLYEEGLLAFSLDVPRK